MQEQEQQGFPKKYIWPFSNSKTYVSNQELVGWHKDTKIDGEYEKVCQTKRTERFLTRIETETAFAESEQLSLNNFSLPLNGILWRHKNLHSSTKFVTTLSSRGNFWLSQNQGTWKQCRLCVHFVYQTTTGKKETQNQKLGPSLHLEVSFTIPIGL